jgi:zinc protease
MRALLVVAALLGSAQTAGGQTGGARGEASGERVTFAEPTRASRLAPRASVNDTLTSAFTAGGVNVILRRTPSNDVVAANLYLLGGTRQTPAELAGLEPFLLEATERGTARYPREALQQRMAELGSAIVTDPDHDWTLFGLRSTVETFDSTWAVLADRLMRPTLDSTQVELVRTQFLSAVRQRRDSPDALLEYLADSVAFAGHPYSIPPLGTEQTLARVRLADMRAFHKEQTVTSRMLLVIVGNVDRARVERLVTATLGTLPRGSYQWSLPPSLARPGTALVTETRSLPTNYILGYFAGPAATSADYQTLRIANAVLSGRLFAEIRSRRNLTYAVNAPFVERAIAAGGLYVTTVQPDLTLSLMQREIRNLQEGWITEDGLDQLVQQFITEYFLDNETNADQARFLARAQLYRGDWRRAAGFVDELREVTPEDVRRVARQYMRNVRFAYVGDPTKLDRGVTARF